MATACYAEDTEILTKEGWKNHLDWIPSEEVACFDADKKELVFSAPSEMLVYDYDGTMIEITGRGVDLLVTPNHRMLILNENNVSRPWAKTEFEVFRADKLPSRFALPAYAPDETGQFVSSYTIPGCRTEPGGLGLTRQIEDVSVLMDDWLSFLGWWISEGWLEKKGGRYTVGFGVSDSANEVIEIRNLVNRIPFIFNEGKNKTIIRWRCLSKILYNWLRENCGQGSANKRIPAFIFGLPKNDRKLFLDALWLGDGHSENQEHYQGFYTTISRQLADDVQRLIIGLGEWGSVVISYKAGAKTSRYVKTNQECYVVHRNKYQKRSLVRGKTVKEIPYNGKVVCFRVPTGFYLTRRNGHPLIAGNTAMEMPTLRAFNRYQLFWSSVWSDMAKYVLTAAVEFGGAKITDFTVDVSTDAVIDVAIDDIQKSATALNDMYDRGLIQDPIAGRIAEQLMRVVVETIGIGDTEEIFSPDLTPDEKAAQVKKDQDEKDAADKAAADAAAAAAQNKNPDGTIPPTGQPPEGEPVPESGDWSKQLAAKITKLRKVSER